MNPIVVKGGLISESSSIWLQSPKKRAKLLKEKMLGKVFGTFFWIQRERLSEIKPPFFDVFQRSGNFRM